ncbi:MAG: hypothetical protein M0P74_15580 [Syntrophales bacterium]|jgi:hypothetical protein|nr:hypothetical protein [Syntrophales bacterium]
MIILDDRKLIETKFLNEQEIEDLVIANSEHFFGPSSVLIPKAKIKTTDGFGTIPDGFAIDLASRIWYVVEAELGHHSVWTHIAPQVTKQLLAVSRTETRQLLTEILVQMVTSDKSVKEKFEDEGIKEINIRKVLGDIFEKAPIIGMPIDIVSNDLREWAETLKNDVRLWMVKKYAQFGAPDIIAYEIPEEYRPVLDTTERNGQQKSGIRTYDVALADIVNAGMLSEGAELTLSYKPRGGKQEIYKGVLSSDGSITVLGQNYSSLSYAAFACIQDAGSDRTTVNGWTSWKTRDGKLLSQLRSEYMKKKEKEAEQSYAGDACQRA